MMQIYYSNKSQRCSIPLRASVCGGHLCAVNSDEVNHVNETNLRLSEVSDMTHDQYKNKFIVYTSLCIDRVYRGGFKITHFSAISLSLSFWEFTIINLCVCVLTLYWDSLGNLATWIKLCGFQCAYSLVNYWLACTVITQDPSTLKWTISLKLTTYNW